MSNRPKPIVLVILDGWGHNEAADHNAIDAAATPVWDRLWSAHPRTLIDTSGIAVGLPSGQMGNSEVGHLNLGSGRVIYQDYTRISSAVEDGGFYENAALVEAVESAKKAGGAVHVMGLLSPGGVHSHEDHLFAAVRLAAQRGVTVYVHAFLDGRDMPPRSAEPSLAKMAGLLDELNCGRIASIVGRYYAMDRDKRWERVSAAYELMTEAKAEFSAESAVAALQLAYERGEGDEFVKPSRVGEPVTIQDGDAVIFMNYRADRAREITRAFIEQDFSEFTRNAHPKLAAFVSLTEYQKDFTASVAFPPEQPKNTLGEYLSDSGLKQLR
ncbi:MAG: 2,3-bisphosphoglycerate-independent phosphoglycerate mutase, partial [Gammaproteobacteria bacterium]|nr:2,3-bisphosphoglycerate-independent phosphoglycerate mutase [Gammaproteobacteria bacterium]